MASTIVPIGTSDRRLPQAGRIRTGEKTNTRQGRKALDSFKFTTSKHGFLVPLAEKYGGTILPWNEPSSPDKWQLVTEATEIDVVVPPEPLTQSYELWDPDLKRRCNGITCTVLVGAPDDADYQDVDCICARKGVLECSYKLRLSVLLPEVQSLGTWRWDSGSKNARQEVPGMVEAIAVLQDRGFYNAKLRLEQRRQPRKVFNVLVLDTGVSIGSLVAGDTRLGSLPVTPSPGMGELVRASGGTGEDDFPLSDSPVSPPSDPDDEIIDAELVSDEPTDFTKLEHVDPATGRAWLDACTGHQRGKVLARARDIATELGEPLPMQFSGITSERVIDRLVAENAHLLKQTEADG